MSSFIEKAACRGRHPGGFSTHQQRSRADLVARLLRQRRVARFIVAPDGFGKSHLAYEYAHVVFSFTHVFWVNARSPCFLRDIDAGTMYNDIIRFDRSPSLVVIEDLPPLDQERARAFSDLIDRLLAYGNEVIVTCAPSCDAYCELHRDRLVLDSADLMLDASEAQTSLDEETRDSGGHGNALRSEMIPCLRWGEDGPEQILAGLNREELAIDERLVIFMLLLLQSGHLNDAEAFIGTKNTHATIEKLALLYPFLGVDLSEGVYEAARFDVQALEVGCGARFDEMSMSSSFETREAFASRCADALMVRGMNDRAIEFMIAFTTKRNGAAWLSTRGWDLVAALSPSSLVDAYFKVDRSIQRGRVSMNAILAWAFFILDDRESSVNFARKAAVAMLGEDAARAIGCVMMLRWGDTADRRKARATLEKMLIMQEVDVVKGCDCAPEPQSELEAMWPLVARLALTFDEDVARGVSDLLQVLDEHRHGNRFDGCGEAVLRLAMAACVWTLEALTSDALSVGFPQDMRWVRDVELPVAFVDSEDFETLLRFSCECVEAVTLQDGRVSWFEMRLASALEAAYEHDPLVVTVMPAFSAMSVIRREQLELFSQRDSHRKANSRTQPLARSRAMGLRENSRLIPRSSTADQVESLSQCRPPIMTVTLFGGFEVRIGDELVDPNVFARRKMRTLVAILVLNRGKEFTRDRLARMLWPNSAEESAKKSFYSLWARLRRALTINGECPYLLRDQYGCRLNPRLVVSDVMQFEQICRMLLFGRTEEREWESIYAQISTDFAEVLLPGEKSNEIILTMREHYHTQLVDALIAASAHMVSTGETRGALWFAREALRRDSSREDAYVAQMEAQIAAEQRAAALETYFSCRRFLARELGIDPSPRIVSLYRQIIESEEEFS